MNETLTFRVKNENNEDVLVALDARIAEMSEPIEENEKDEVIPLLIQKKVLEKISSFYELYNYNKDELKSMNYDILSDNLYKNLGDKNYYYFVEYFDDENTLNIEKFKPLMDACYNYHFKYLSELCDVVIGTDFFCETSEEGLEGFKKKFNMPELTEDETTAIMDENKEVFENLSQEFSKTLENVVHDAFEQDIGKNLNKNNLEN